MADFIYIYICEDPVVVIIVFKKQKYTGFSWYYFKKLAFEGN